jgi:hypothetical protein
VTPLYKVSWALWIAGTILIVGSWINVVPNPIGWIGFGVALAGTLLSMASQSRGLAGSASQGKPFLCDSCLLNHESLCLRPDRPNATECPDYERR